MIDPSALVVLWLIGVVFAASLAGTVVHELGHAVTAAVVGFRVLSVRAAVLEARPTARGWRLRLLGHWQRPSLVTFDPVRPDGIRGRHVLMTAAGPAAQLLAGGVALVAAERWGGLLWAAVLVIALAALLNVVPLGLRRRGFWLDGDWLLAWLLRPGTATQRLALGSVQLDVAAGRRPREWDERWVLLAAGSYRHVADRQHLEGLLWAYTWALDRGEVGRAGALLARAFAARRMLAPRECGVVAAEAAYFVARHRRRVGLARRLLDSMRTRPPGPLAAEIVERARAAISLAAGEPEAALAACDRAAAELDAAAAAGEPSGAVLFAGDLVDAVRADALAVRRTLMR